MKIEDSFKTRIIYLIISLLITSLVVLLFFIGNNPWDIYKIIFCIVISILMILSIPSYRYCILYIKHSSFLDGFRLGMLLGLLSIMIPLVGSPYFGIRYLFDK